MQHILLTLCKLTPRKQINQICAQVWHIEEQCKENICNICSAQHEHEELCRDHKCVFYFRHVLK